MAFPTKKFFYAAQWLFLAGIFFLIVRKNTYPWPIKRASDILFLTSFAAVVALIAGNKQWRKISQYKNAFLGFSLIIAGVIIASYSNYLIVGTKIDAAGVLEFGRFLEAGMIFLTAGFLAREDSSTVKKAAVAQLSTLAYLFVFIAPNNLAGTTGRFQLFENWPSNVGYYLTVSIGLCLIFLFRSIQPFRKTFFVFYAAAAGFFGILLWSQSRASWLALAIVSIVILALTARQVQILRKKFIVFTFLTILSLPILGYIILPTTIKTEILLRFFPQYRTVVNREAGSSTTGSSASKSLRLAENLAERNLAGSQVLDDPVRLLLWKEWTEKLIRQPLGLGVNPANVIYEGAQKGPHNTILEIIEFSGIIGLAGFVYIYYLCFKNIVACRKAFPNSPWPLYLFTALAALAVASFFDGMSTFRLTYVLLGLGIFVGRKNPSETAVADETVLIKNTIPKSAESLP